MLPCNYKPGKVKTMATLKEIAQKAGVSQGTVSRILSEDSTLNVSSDTRENVLRIALELGYKTASQRQMKAKSLGNAKSEKQVTIGIAQMFETEQLKNDIYYMILKQMVDTECFSLGWDTALLYRDAEGKFVKNSNVNLDGIIAIGRFTIKEIQSFEKLTSNIVFIDSSPDESKYHSIVPNYHMAIRLVINYFKKMGYKKVAYSGAVYTYNDVKRLTMDPRFYYYKNHMVNRQIFDENLIVECEMNSKSSYEAMNRYIKVHKRPPEALFMSSDAIAAGIIKSIHENGFKVPEDCNIVTYNNTAFSEDCNPPLDSIEVYLQENAKEATYMLTRMWEAQRLPRKTVIPCRLITRGSVKAKHTSQ